MGDSRFLDDVVGVVDDSAAPATTAKCSPDASDEFLRSPHVVGVDLHDDPAARLQARAAGHVFAPLLLVSVVVALVLEKYFVLRERDVRAVASAGFGVDNRVVDRWRGQSRSDDDHAQPRLGSGLGTVVQEGERFPHPLRTSPAREAGGARREIRQCRELHSPLDQMVANCNEIHQRQVRGQVAPRSCGGRVTQPVRLDDIHGRQIEAVPEDASRVRRPRGGAHRNMQVGIPLGCEGQRRAKQARGCCVAEYGVIWHPQGEHRTDGLKRLLARVRVAHAPDRLVEIERSHTSALDACALAAGDREGQMSQLRRKR